jgi:hypothetical protein
MGELSAATALNDAATPCVCVAYTAARLFHANSRMLTLLLLSFALLLWSFRTSKEIVELNSGLFGAAGLAQADPKAITRRRAHGILMALNFLLVCMQRLLLCKRLQSS